MAGLGLKTLSLFSVLVCLWARSAHQAGPHATAEEEEKRLYLARLSALLKQLGLGERGGGMVREVALRGLVADRIEAGKRAEPAAAGRELVTAFHVVSLSEAGRFEAEVLTEDLPRGRRYCNSMRGEMDFEGLVLRVSAWEKGEDDGERCSKLHLAHSGAQQSLNAGRLVRPSQGDSAINNGSQGELQPGLQICRRDDQL